MQHQHNSMLHRVIFLICFTATLAYGQDSTAIHKKKTLKLTPYNPKADHQNWGVYAAAIILPIGNQATLAGTIGVDVGFLKNNSVGIQSYFLYTSGSDDQVYDTAGVYHDVGNDYSTFERAIMVNYKHYFNFQKVREKTGIALYSGVMARYGQITDHKDPLYQRGFISNKETDYSGTVFIGALYSVSNYYYSAYDFNIGCSYKETDITNVYSKGLSVETEINKPKMFAPRVGFALYIWLDRPHRKTTGSYNYTF